ncbi:MAG: deoxyuridine 5'-triphosphate nucleotidohydrolase [Eubacteriales bacterium]
MEREFKITALNKNGDSLIERVGVFEKVSKEISGVEKINVTLPKRATSGSAGYDFFTPFGFTLSPGEGIIIPTGVRVNIKNGWLLMIFPRSGLGFKHRLRLDNTVGIIDSDYYFSKNEGHIIVKITNCGDSLLTVLKGEAFCQGVFTRYGITLDDETVGKRDGGFGSTDR